MIGKTTLGRRTIGQIGLREGCPKDMQPRAVYFCNVRSDKVDLRVNVSMICQTREVSQKM